MNNSFDWSPHTSRFIIRMLTPTHEMFTAFVVQEIWSQLKSVTFEDGDITAIVDQILLAASSDVYLYGHEPINKKYPQRSPDAAFVPRGFRYPTLVIETSYSQSKKNLAVLADDYIQGSNGNISTIIGLDLEYRSGSKEASVTSWKPRIVPDLEKSEICYLETYIFQETEVRISLSDFH